MLSLHGDSKNAKRKDEEFANGDNIIQVIQDSLQFVFHQFESVESVSILHIIVILRNVCIIAPHWEKYYVI